MSSRFGTSEMMRNFIFRSLATLGCLCGLSCPLVWCVSPYIHHVYEFRPAPGQFVNVLPAYHAGDTELDIVARVDSLIANHKGGLISLGSFGGYVTFGFDHPVVNVPGEYDLKICGNAVYTDPAYIVRDTTAITGSPEPGIVMVSVDANQNGLPDDEWYELAGSEHQHPLTRREYAITYYRTPADHVATPVKDKYRRYLTDTTYIRYTTNRDEEGYIAKNQYHNQAYYPEWIAEDSYTLSGTLLRNTMIDENGYGTEISLYVFDWGYVDNHPNTYADDPERHVSEFKLDWAVNAAGEPVALSTVDFVRVYTAQLQFIGWMGETSTEVTDAWDLHPEAKPTALNDGARCDEKVVKCLMPDGTLLLRRGDYIYDLMGRRR